MWKTSLISFSSSAVMLFSFASFDARPRFGAGAELAAPRRLGGCARVKLGRRGVFLCWTYHCVGCRGMLSQSRRIRGFEVGKVYGVIGELCHGAKPRVPSLQCQTLIFPLEEILYYMYYQSCGDSQLFQVFDHMYTVQPGNLLWINSHLAYSKPSLLCSFLILFQEKAWI